MTAGVLRCGFSEENCKKDDTGGVMDVTNWAQEQAVVDGVLEGQETKK